MENIFTIQEQDFLNKNKEIISNDETNDLIIQFLYENNYIESAKLLESKTLDIEKRNESEKFLSFFRTQNYKECMTMLNKSSFSNEQKNQLIKILKIKEFIQMIKKNFNGESNKIESLQYLRTDLSPFIEQENLKKLSLLLFSQNQEEMTITLKENFQEYIDEHKLLLKIKKILNIKGDNNSMSFTEIIKQYNDIVSLSNPPNFIESKLIEKIGPNNKNIEGEIWSLILSHKKNYLAATFSNGYISIFKIELIDNKFNITCISYFKAHQKLITSISWSYNDQFILSSSNDGTVKIFNPLTSECIKSINNIHQNGNNSVNFLFNSNDTIISGGIDKKIYITDINQKNKKLELGNNFNRIRQIILSDFLHSIIIVPASLNDIVVYNINSNSILFKLEITEQIIYVNISKSDRGKFLLVNQSTINSNIALYDLCQKKIVNRYYGHTQKIYTIDCCFGGEKDEYIISGSEDALIYIWNRYYESSPLFVIKGHTGTVNSCQMFNKNIIISGSDDLTIRIWTCGNYIVNYENKVENNIGMEIENDNVMTFMISDDNNSDNEGNVPIESEASNSDAESLEL
jgi:WD40 repeat protein